MDSRDRNQLVADTQSSHRRSKRRAFFTERRHREDSLMYREPTFPEEAAITLQVNKVFHLPSRKVLYRPSWPNAVAIFPRYTPIVDGERLRMRIIGLAAYNGPSIDAFDLETGELLYTSDAHDRPVHCVSIVNAATNKIPVFASCCHGGTIKLIELQTGNVLAKVRAAVSGPCYGVCIVDAKISLLVAGCCKNVEIWTLPKGRHLTSLEGHTGRVMCVAAHRSNPGHIDDDNPGFIASGDDLGNIRTWLLEDPWTPLLIIEAHAASILSITVKKPLDNCDIDRYRLFTTSEDRTFRIFDAMNGECLGCVSNHTGPIQALSILSLNGPIIGTDVSKELRWKEDIILTAGLDKRINFWRLNDLSLLFTMERGKPVRGVAATVFPKPMMVATSMDEGLEIIDLVLYEGLSEELKHLITSHEEEVHRPKDKDIYVSVDAR